MVLTYIIAIAVLLLAALALLLRRLVLNVESVECDPSWITQFSVARYRPMLRLLSDDDYEFLKASSGCSAAVLRRMRSERREIFRVYLKNLIRDFNRLHRAARVLALDSPVDRPDLAAGLIRTRTTFERAVLAVRFRLALHSLGLGKVDARELLSLLDKLSGECRVLAPQAARQAY